MRGYSLTCRSGSVSLAIQRLLNLAWEVAGRVVIGLLLLQDRDDLAADGLSLPAAWMKIAAAGRIDRAGNITFENDAFALAFDLRIRYRDGREQSLGVRMQWRFVEVLAF